MPSKQILTAVFFLAVVSLSCGMTRLNAQIYTIPWHTIDGGGGYASGGNFELEGTIGQHDAGPVMSGGNFEVRGGYWVGARGPVTVIPDSYTVTRGDYVSGGLPELSTSDNMDLTIRRRNADLVSRTEFVVQSTSPRATPTVFEFTLEGNVFARGNVVQTIELYDYDASDWELVLTTDANRTPMPDKTVTATPGGDLSRFVNAGTMSIEARILYKSDRNRQKFASTTDQAIWTIN